MVGNTDAIQQLCLQFDKDMKVSIDGSEYMQALDEIFAMGSSEIASVAASVEEVIVRSYQDHTETRERLKEMVCKDITHALDLFERLSIQSVHVLVGVMGDMESSLPLLQELKRRLNNGEDRHVEYLASCVTQCLSKYSYKFASVSFLIRSLGMRIKEADIKPFVILCFAQLHAQFGTQFESKYTNFIGSLVLEADVDIGDDPLTIIIENLIEMYPVATSLCSTILLDKELDGYLKSKALDATSTDLQFNIDLLKLLSVACIDDNVRVHVAKNYMSLLEESVKKEEYRLYSALVLIKTWSFSQLRDVDISNLCSILIDSFVQHEATDSDVLDMALEGLVYLSLKPEIKSILRHNEKFIGQIVGMCDNCSKSQMYGILVILANLSSFSTTNDKEALNKLQNYSQPSHEKDDKDYIVKFNNNKILQTQVLSKMIAKKVELTGGCKEQLVRIIYNVTRVPIKHMVRGVIVECVKQGCITLVLEYLVGGLKNTEKGGIRVLAIRSLSKMLIYTNPSLVFQKYSPINAIPFLFEFLSRYSGGDDDDISDDDLITITDSYESLLALTNLASSVEEGDAVCKNICQSNGKYWQIIENLMLDESVVLQRSALELVCNLMNYPIHIAAHFFNFDNEKSRQNYENLIKLMQLPDIESQRAVCAIFANVCSSIPFVCEQLAQEEKLWDTAMQVYIHQWKEDVEIRQRLLILFYSVLSSDDKITHSGNKQLIEALQDTAKTPDTGPDFLQVIPPILQRLTAQPKHD